MKHIFAKLAAFLGSRACFYAILAFFVFQALWIALSAVYPMAFDEDFHLGIIRIYADHWLPFLSEHPAGADAFGAVTRDPSYLYHYLMSFPYRVLAAIVPSEVAQVLVLRFLNIGLFAYALLLFRRVLYRALPSSALAHITLALFTLIPIVPQLASQINYDNLLMVLMGWICLLVYRLIDAFRLRQLPLSALVLLLNLCLLASLVKYAFLPIFGAVVVFVAGYGYRCWRGSDIAKAWAIGWRSLSRPLLVVAALLTVVSSGLFVQRFGVNVLRYHTPIADCGEVLSYDNCKAYGPWIRNHDLAHSKGFFDTSPFTYTNYWLDGLWLRLFFAVNGPASNFTNYPPLPLPYHAAAVLAIAGLVALLLCSRRVFAGQPFAVFAATVAVLYCGALWFEDYSQYLETGQPVAINGRYLIPVLFLVAVLIGRALHYVLANRRKTKMVLAGVVLTCFLQGGGVITFIMRSDPSWYWPNQAVVKTNDAARRFLAPVVIEGKKYY